LAFALVASISLLALFFTCLSFFLLFYQFCQSF
jgi:hypothetical protein